MSQDALNLSPEKMLIPTISLIHPLFPAAIDVHVENRWAKFDKDVGGKTSKSTQQHRCAV